MNQPLKPPYYPQWNLYNGDGKPVCTFVPTVLERQEIRTLTEGKCRTRIRLSLAFANNTNAEVTVNSSDLDHLNWPELDCRCIVNSNTRGARAFVADTIRAGLFDAPGKIMYHFDRTGIFHLEDAVIFAAGDRVITRSSATEPFSLFEPEQVAFRLDIDPRLSRTDAFGGMQELISLSPELGRILVAHVISGITRAAFKKAGFTPCAVLVVMGKSGLLKSHYVPHMVQLYNRKDGIGPVTRFNSTKRFIEDALYDYSECTAVIDDLHTAESSGIKRRNEETTEEIIRRISDDTGRGRMEGHTLVQRQFRGNAVFIGEYTIGKASTIPRALIVELTNPPNGAILDKYQRHKPLLVSTFYFYFIQWYVEHFDEICSEIDSKLTQHRKMATTFTIHGRLCDTQFYLQISYMVFLEFCVKSQCCSREDARDEYTQFCTHLDKLIKAQQVRFDQDSIAKSIDYSNLIRELYNNGCFRLSKNKKRFDPSIHDGLIHYDCLCLRGESIRNKLNQVIPHFNFDDCIDSLRRTNALKLVGQKKTVQIVGTGGIRFYAIRI